MLLSMFNGLALLSICLLSAVGFVEGIEISPDLADAHADSFKSKVTSFSSGFHNCNSDDTCQADAWKWMTSLGGKVQTNAEELLKNLAPNPNIFDELQLYKAAVDDVISSARQHLDAVDLQVMTKDVEAALMVLFTELEAEFPAPESALGHDERVAMMSDVMTRVRGTILRVGVEHGIAEERLARHLDIMCPKIVGLIILAGDLAEQHPMLLEGLLLMGSVLIIPQTLLRPFLEVLGFGPLGPIKGSGAAWAQRMFFGAAVPKGSLFSQLQGVAMAFGRN